LNTKFLPARFKIVVFFIAKSINSAIGLSFLLLFSGGEKMVVRTISWVDPGQYAKVVAVLLGVIYLVFGLIFALFAGLFGAMIGTLPGGDVGAAIAAAFFGGLVLAVFMAVMGLVFGAIFGFIGALIYNFVASKIGGIKFELK